MTRRLLAAACAMATAALLLAPAASADPAPNPDKQCKKGYVRGADATMTYDQNGNGFVCVDPMTGDVRDDKDQFAGDTTTDATQADENGNHVVCTNGDGVYTDDDGSGNCPPGFGPSVPLTPALAADENHDFIVCRNDANGTYVDDTINQFSVDCPPGYTPVFATIG
jgi:hypothetical protein